MPESLHRLGKGSSGLRFCAANAASGARASAVPLERREWAQSTILERGCTQAANGCAAVGWIHMHQPQPLENKRGAAATLAGRRELASRSTAASPRGSLQLVGRIRGGIVASAFASGVAVLSRIRRAARIHHAAGSRIVGQADWLGADGASSGADIGERARGHRRDKREGHPPGLALGSRRDAGRRS